jgi:hypothetical protein
VILVQGDESSACVGNPGSDRVRSSSARNMFDELLHQSFSFSVDFARFFLRSLLSSKSCFRAAF